MALMICLVTAPVPGPTSMIRRWAEAGSATYHARALAKGRPLGKIAPVV